MIAKRNKIRVAKYKRVSTDEQKLKKNSIIAQDEILDEYIKNNPDMVLVGDFSDEGVSGSKIKRTELQRLLELVEEREVDLILVTKLDRWFRSVAFYYRVQEVLERNNVAWKTILEDYNTLTADGKLKVNIMLSVAQNEVERTSERIKVVFDSKVKHKQAITGSLPYGFKIIEGNGAKKVVKDPETEHIVKDMLDNIKVTQSIRGTMYYINEKYDCDLRYNRIYRLLANTMLYGKYHDIENYCEAYITEAEFNAIQNSLKKNIRKRETNRIYIFSGLLICPCCGRKLGGTYSTTTRPSGKKYTYKFYRCIIARRDKQCDYKSAINENVFERKLLKQVIPQLENLIVEAQIEEKDSKVPKVNKASIKDQMSRLNDMYEKGRIDEDEYDRKYEALEKKLKVKNEPKKDYSHLKEILNTDFKSLYATFTELEKQMFWRSIIDSIELHDDDIVINFL